MPQLCVAKAHKRCAAPVGSQTLSPESGPFRQITQVIPPDLCQRSVPMERLEEPDWLLRSNGPQRLWRLVRL
jgi:hypothetical protein